MLNLGVIGTNWISHQFVTAAHESGLYQLKAVYSRKEETAQKFGEAYQVSLTETDLEKFCAMPDLDVIYIASPNSLHYPQAKVAIEQGKHVIVEKPAVSRVEELEELLELAKNKNVFYFEAARNIHEENFKKVKAILPDTANILGANFSYMKYSSRYDLVLNGEEPNIFSPHFSGGALMDLGIYLVYASVAFFGKPESVHYFSRMIPTNVDGIGNIVLRYKKFDVSLMTGKIATSFMPSEIYSLSETIVLDGVNSINDIQIFHKETGEFEKIEGTKKENPMIEEAQSFAQVILHPNDQAWQKEYQTWLTICRDVHEILQELRKDSGIRFDADKV